MSKHRPKLSEREQVLELVEEHGLRAAIQAAIDICNDKQAPAPARATASGLLMRVGAVGGFGKNYVPPEPEGPLDHLSPEEYHAAMKRYQKKLDYDMAEHEAYLAEQETALDAAEAEFDEEQDREDEGGAFE